MNWWIISLVLIMLATFWPALFILIPGLDERSTLGSIPWLLFYTLPMGAVLFLIWLVLIVEAWLL